MRKGCPLVISAPSGAGKSTLCHMLLREFPNLSFSISCTTRSPRPGEIHGKDYIFLDDSQFMRIRDEGGFAEWAIVHDHYYGTPLDPLKERLKNGADVLLDVDVQGAAQIRASLSDTFFVFIVPPSIGELERRLRSRNADSESSIRKRLKNVAGELRQASWYDALVINDDLEEAYQSLRAAYVSATLKPTRNPWFLNSLVSESMEMEFDRIDYCPGFTQ